MTKTNNVLGKRMNSSQFKSLMAGIALLVSSGLLNTLQAQDIVTKKQLIKKEQKANEKLPSFADPFAYLYGTGLQKHINELIANQHLNTDNLDPAFLKEEVLKILKGGDTEEKLTPVSTVSQITTAVEDSVMALLVFEYAQVSQVYIDHINNNGSIVLQKNRTEEGGDPFNRVALPREVRISILMELFGKKGLFGEKGRLGNTKAGKEFAEKMTIELEQIINESLTLFITKFAQYRKASDELTVEDAVYRATNDAFLFAKEKITPLAKSLVIEAVNEIFQAPQSTK